jgi:hypothetical protein
MLRNTSGHYYIASSFDLMLSLSSQLVAVCRNYLNVVIKIIGETQHNMHHPKVAVAMDLIRNVETLMGEEYDGKTVRLGCFLMSGMTTVYCWTELKK